MPPIPQYVALTLAVAMVQAIGAEPDGHAFTQMAKFELGVGTLTEIQRQLGPSTIHKTGDAGDYEEKLCYLVSEGTVSFLAGEVGGQNNLAGFELTSKRLQNCNRWPTDVAEPKFKIGSLYIGMSKTRFKTVVPKVRRIDDGRLIGAFESKLPYTECDFKTLSPDVRDQTVQGKMQAYWDVFVSVVGRFEHQKLIEVRVWKTVTN